MTAQRIGGICRVHNYSTSHQYIDCLTNVPALRVFGMDLKKITHDNCVRLDVIAPTEKTVSVLHRAGKADTYFQML